MILLLQKQIRKAGYLLFALNSVILFLIFLSYFLRSHLADSTPTSGYLYYAIAAFGQSGLFNLIPLLFFYLPLSYTLINKKFNYFLLATLYFLLDILAFANGIVFQLYKFHINGFVLDMLLAPNAGEIFVLNTQLVFLTVSLLFGCGFAFFLLACLLLRFVSHVNSHWIRLHTLFLLLCLANAHLLHAYAAATNKPTIQNVATCLPQFYPLTANSLIQKLGFLSEEDTYHYVKDPKINTGVTYPLHPLQHADSIPGKNIIFIVLDSWNPRTFNDTVMPNIFRFGQQARVFNHHLSSSHGTQGGIFGLFFGISATYWKEMEITGTHPIFFETLKKRGYDLQLFPSATLMNPPLYQVIFRNIPNARTETEGNTPLERDQRLTADFLQYLTQRQTAGDQRPFFSFLFYDLLHAIDIPKTYQHRFQPSWEYANYLKLNNEMDPTPFFNLYRNCAWHVDSLVGCVLQALKQHNLLSNSIVIVTGDHGQEFNENHKNYWGHNGNYSYAQIQVPLVYYHPDSLPATYHHRTTHYDITPTLLQTELGLLNPLKDYSMGTHLWDTVRLPYHLVGNRDEFGFLFKGLIYDKKLAGQLLVTDSLLNPTNRRVDSRLLLEAIRYKNSFMKQKSGSHLHENPDKK